MQRYPYIVLVVFVFGGAEELSLEGQKQVEHQCEKLEDYRSPSTYETEILSYSCNKEQYAIRNIGEGVSIHCQGNKLTCATFPHLVISKNSSLEKVMLFKCNYEEPIACLLRKMNVQVKKVELYNFFTPLTKKHVEGLDALTALSITGGTDSNVPPEVFSSLPDLEHFQHESVQLTLIPGQFQCPRLTRLVLSRDSIKELPPRVFEGLPNLKYLDLSYNEITTLQDNVFQGLVKLRTLLITSPSFSDKKAITSWSTGALSSLVSLKHLGVKATNVPDGAFRGLTELESIEITGGKTPTRLGLSAFRNLTSLRKLAIISSSIQDLPRTVFHGCKLNELSLKENLLEKLHPKLFEGQSEMKILDLSHNQLTNVNADVFKPLRNLVVLNISFNRIEVLDEFVFSILRNLQTLKISFNLLKHVADSAFRGVPLLVLELNYNQLSFQSDPFRGLKELKELNLNHNNIDTMCRSWQDGLPNLTKLDLSYNSFAKLNGSDFFFTEKNLIVDLQYNKIRSITLDPMVVMNSVFILDQNPFNCDCQMYYFVEAASSSPYLRNFHLNEVECTTPLPHKGTHVTDMLHESFECDEESCASGCKCMFQPAKNIVHAQCSSLSNQQSNLSKAVSFKFTHAPNALIHLPFNNVTEIDLSGLNLTEMPHYQIPRTVQFIDLSNNNLKFFPRELLSQNMKFALRNNSLNCDCMYYEYIADLIQNSFKIVDFERIACDGGSLLADAKRLCEVSLAFYVGISLAIFAVLCTFVMAFSYKYSFELKIFIAKYLPCLFPEEKYDESKKYDVFVSYAHKDEDFVRDVLLEHLEGPPNYLKACVHHRDWLVGETIPYNIAKSVEESRRTLIVLSQNFLSSIWGLMEFRLAHTQAAKEGRARVIIVLLEDVTDKKELDRELRAYLHTNTYIKWGEPWFWEKLFYALPKRGMVVDTGEEKRIRALANKLMLIR